MVALPISTAKCHSAPLDIVILWGAKLSALPKTRYARSGDVHVAYQVFGEGPIDLVFVPGFVSHIENYWDEPNFARWLHRLASFARVIMFDKRGTGLSDHVSELPSMDQRMDDVRAVMDAVDIDSAAIMGISEGGSLASVFAAHHPARCRALVLYGAFARFTSWYPTEESLEQLFQYIESGWGSGASIPFFALSKADDPAFTEWWGKFERLGANPGAAIALMRMNSQIDIADILPTIHTPTLVIHRTDDVTIDVEAGRLLAEQIPNSRYVEHPGADHIPWVGDYVDAMSDEIEVFLTGHKSAPAIDRVLATVLFTDIVDSTARAEALGDKAWRDVADAHDKAVRAELARFRGNEVKALGDGFLANAMFGLCAWMDELGLNRDAHKLSLIFSTLVAAVILGWLTITYRADVAGAILGAGEPGRQPFWRRLLASTWHVVMILYLMAAWMVSFVRLTLDLPAAYGLISAPLVILVGAMVVYAIALVIIDRIYERRARRFRARQPSRIEADDDAPLAELEEMVVHHRDAAPTYRPVFKALWEHGAAVIVALIAIGELFRAWGVDVGAEGNPVTAALDTLAIIFLAYIGYKAVNIYIDRKIADEGDEADAVPGEPGEEMSGAGASRIATLLPLFRNFLVFTIFIIAGMIVASQLGVDVAPLFAGAGVVGLAIGFGAQTLIRDIFSGAFFLLDDAFRKGEYIDLGNVRGTVEKISMRSFQLRHHNGPVHTIPFGEIHQLTNFSRDWVLMKLPLRVTYDTDVERVRKLIKKLGQQLLEHPDVGKNFLQPLKSQGVFRMEDSAMIIRIKFMTRPGDQFTTRKVVYAAIRELFEREGIRFAHREVTVRLAEDQRDKELTDRERKAITAAARAVDDEAKPAASPADAL